MTKNKTTERFRTLLHEWLDDYIEDGNSFDESVSFVFRHYASCMTDETAQEFIDIFKKDAITHRDFLEDLDRDRSKWEEIRAEWGWSKQESERHNTTKGET